MNDIKEIFWDVIKILDKHNILDHVVAIEFENIRITVPIPQAYLLQKIIMELRLQI